MWPGKVGAGVVGQTTKRVLLILCKLLAHPMGWLYYIENTPMHQHLLPVCSVVTHCLKTTNTRQKHCNKSMLHTHGECLLATVTYVRRRFHIVLHHSVAVAGSVRVTKSSADWIIRHWLGSTSLEFRQPSPLLPLLRRSLTHVLTALATLTSTTVAGCRWCCCFFLSTDWLIELLFSDFCTIWCLPKPVKSVTFVCECVWFSRVVSIVCVCVCDRKTSMKFGRKLHVWLNYRRFLASWKKNATDFAIKMADSTHGTVKFPSCHIFSDLDWDLQVLLISWYHHARFFLRPTQEMRFITTSEARNCPKLEYHHGNRVFLPTQSQRNSISSISNQFTSDFLQQKTRAADDFDAAEIASERTSRIRNSLGPG